MQTYTEYMAESKANAAPTPALLRKYDVLRLTGLTDSAMYRQIQMGTFPRPLKLSARSSAWVEAEVFAWIERRIADRDARTAQ